MAMTPDERATLVEIRDTVKALETALIGTELVPGVVVRLEKEVASNRKRIAALERFRWYIAGIAMGVGGVVEYIHSHWGI